MGVTQHYYFLRQILRCHPALLLLEFEPNPNLNNPNLTLEQCIFTSLLRKPPHTGIFNCLPPQRSRCNASTCAARKTRIVLLGAAAGVSGSLHWYGPFAHYLVHRIQAIILSGVARASQSKQPQVTRFCSSPTAACGTGGIQHPYPKTNAITSVIQQYI